MAVKLRLKEWVQKQNLSIELLPADSRSPRDGRFFRDSWYL